LTFFIIWKIYKKTNFIRGHEVDLITGRREMNLKEIIAAEREERASWGIWKKYVTISF